MASVNNQHTHEKMGRSRKDQAASPTKSIFWGAQFFLFFLSFFFLSFLIPCETVRKMQLLQMLVFNLAKFLFLPAILFMFSSIPKMLTSSHHCACWWSHICVGTSFSMPSFLNCMYDLGYAGMINLINTKL